MHFLTPLESGCCDLLWPRECGGDFTMCVLDLGLKRPQASTLPSWNTGRVPCVRRKLTEGGEDSRLHDSGRVPGSRGTAAPGVQRDATWALPSQLTLAQGRSLCEAPGSRWHCPDPCYEKRIGRWCLSHQEGQDSTQAVVCPHEREGGRVRGRHNGRPDRLPLIRSEQTEGMRKPQTQAVHKDCRSQGWSTAELGAGRQADRVKRLECRGVQLGERTQWGKWGGDRTPAGEEVKVGELPVWILKAWLGE